MANAPSATKYDVALSFLSGDQLLAQQLYDEASSQMAVFFYPRNQEELAGTDGMESFRVVFREQSRLNVVLYRQPWGETPWTRIEATAIKERCLTEGWSTLLMVLIDTASAPPKWLPDTHLWLRLDDYSMAELAVVVRAHAQRQGATVRKKDALSAATRLHASSTWEKERARRIIDEGFQASREHRDGLLRALDSLTLRVATRLPDLELHHRKEETRFWIRTDHASAVVHVYMKGQVDESRILMILFRGIIDFPGERRFRAFTSGPEEESEIEFFFDLTQSTGWSWRSPTTPLRSFSDEDLADHCLRVFLEFAETVARQTEGGGDDRGPEIRWM